MNGGQGHCYCHDLHKTGDSWNWSRRRTQDRCHQKPSLSCVLAWPCAFSSRGRQEVDRRCLTATPALTGALSAQSCFIARGRCRETSPPALRNRTATLGERRSHGPPKPMAAAHSWAPGVRFGRCAGHLGTLTPPEGDSTARTTLDRAPRWRVLERVRLSGRLEP